jgi:hypothetical protein
MNSASRPSATPTACTQACTCPAHKAAADALLRAAYRRLALAIVAPSDRLPARTTYPSRS